MRTLVFAGSTRTASFNRQLARVAADTVQSLGGSPTLAELADYDIPLYDAELEARGTPEAVLRFKQLAWEHPAWIICTPEYNAALPGRLKNLLDWVSSPVKGDAVWSDGMRSTRGKVVGILSASPGGLGGIRTHTHLASLLLNLHAWVAPTSYALGRAGEAFGPDGALLSAHAQEGVRAVAAQVLDAARRLHATA